MKPTAVTKKDKHTRPFDPHKKQKVTRANIVMPADSEKTVTELQAEVDQQVGPGSAEGPLRRTVARRDIHIANDVFQWRGDERRDRWNRQNHIYTLAKAISDGKRPLDRLMVFPVGTSFYVVDGHHRLAAYDSAGWTKGIPVEVFAGSLAEARLRALKCNVKDKLVMTTQAKSDAAWRITKENLGELAPEQVELATGVSRRTIFSMKSVWKELNERKDLTDDDRAKLPKLTWKQARDMRDGKKTEMTDFDYNDWQYQQAEALIDLMRRHNVIISLLKDAGVTALALQMLSGDFPARLIEEWTGDYQELVEDLAKRIANPDDADSPPF